MTTPDPSRPFGRSAAGDAAVLAATLVATAAACGVPEASTGSTPEDGSGDPGPTIASVTFDWSTHRRLAPGSDNWPLTWASDGHQYTSWGDGGGFGGTNRRYRVSLGVARVEGGPEDVQATNVWGHAGNSRVAADVEGKTYGILALGDSLYMWVSPGSGPDNWRSARLHRSGDGGRSWRPTAVALIGGLDSLGVPAFLQQGRGHEWSGDGHVYVYAAGVRDVTSWEVQVPGRIYLLRVPEASISEPEAYRYFAGTDSTGEPTWSAERADRRPVFEDPRGVMRSSAIFVRPLGLYLLISNHTARNEGNIGIFEGPAPWGPWQPVLDEHGWGEGHMRPNTFYWNIAPAWLGPDGLDFVLVFTGKEENDAWNSVRGRFQLAGGPGSPGRSP